MKDEQTRAKHYLSRLYWTMIRITRKQDEIDQMRALVTRSTAQISDMPRGGSGRDWTDVEIAVLELEDKIHDEIIKLCREKREIFDMIDQVEDARFRTLLEKRYRNFMRFEEIAVEMNYDYDYVRELHGLALTAAAEKIPHNPT